MRNHRDVVALLLAKCVDKKRQWKPPSKKEQGEKLHMPKPEEHEGIPQHQHYPLAKRREDINPKYHEEKDQDVA
jgi:hypothetical protein